MACFLPQFIFLKSNRRDKYLRYRKEGDSNHAFLQFSEDEKKENVEIQYVKFEVEKSETMEGFVHIRSCYNNKYWVRKSGDGDGSKSSSWIVAEANEPEEDPSKLSCTLFKPFLVDADVDQDGEFVEHEKPHKIRLVHVDQIGQQECVALADSDLLTLQEGQVDDDDVFTAYSAVPVMVLPPRVAFTNHEEKYGALTTTAWGVTHVDFNTKDIGRAGVAIQLDQYTLSRPPYIQCQHISYGYWRLPNGQNLVRVTDSTAGGNLTFSVTPIRLIGNTIALRNRFNVNQFANCASLSSAELENVLWCKSASISQDAKFGVHEPVLRREISNVVYHVEDARVYNIRSVEKYRDARENRTSVEQTGWFGNSYTKTQTMTWSDSLSITTSVGGSMSASIPFVGVSFGVELSKQTDNTVVFGREESVEEKVDFGQNLTLPPRTRITLLVVGTRAMCDVPFTCNVVDTLSNGDIFRYTKHDGLYSGANEFGFQTTILEDKL